MRDHLRGVFLNVKLTREVADETPKIKVNGGEMPSKPRMPRCALGGYRRAAQQLSR